MKSVINMLKNKCTKPSSQKAPHNTNQLKKALCVVCPGHEAFLQEEQSQQMSPAQPPGEPCWAGAGAAAPLSCQEPGSEHRELIWSHRRWMSVELVFISLFIARHPRIPGGNEFALKHEPGAGRAKTAPSTSWNCTPRVTKGAAEELGDCSFPSLY